MKYEYDVIVIGQAEVFLSAAVTNLRDSVKPWHTKLTKLILRR